MFPRWMNYFLPLAIVGFFGISLYAPAFITLTLAPQTTDVGYAPAQPIPYSHALHAGELGIDCRYCHTTVEKTAFAAIPPTQTCMNCHTTIKKTVTTTEGTTDNPKLVALMQSWRTGDPIEWVKVHDLPDYSYFNHSAHVNKGVGCVSCHGRIDRMDVVYQAKPLNMAWCLECHNQPEKFLRPRDEVTNLAFEVSDVDKTHPQIAMTIRDEHGMTPSQPITQELLGTYLKETYKIRDHEYMTSCSTCHR